MRKLIALLGLLVCFCPLSLWAQASFPQFGSIENDGVASLNRFNLGWTKSITLVSMPSRGLTFDPRLTYNSFIWQKNGTVWSPVVGEDGNPTWGWNKDGSSFLGGPLSYQVLRYRCVANDSTNQWTYEYTNFKTPSQTFDLDVRLAEQPDMYPECSDQGQAVSSYGHDASGAPTGYLLVLRGNGGPMPWPLPSNAYQYGNNNTQPIIFAPGGAQVDMSGSLADSNGNKTESNINNNVETWTDSIGRRSLIVTNDTSNHLTTYSYPDTGGATQTWTMSYTLNNVYTAFNCANISDYTQSSIYLPASLALPGSNNGSYTFEYEATPGHPGYTTGRISKITLPTGGWISYSYSGVNCDDGSPIQLVKTINDGSSSHSWTYTRTNNGDGTWQTVENTPSNDVQIVFNAQGVPTNEKTYAGALGGSLLQEVQTSYSPDSTPNRTTIINGSKSRTTDYQYDVFGNLTWQWEYDWNSTTTYLRTTQNQYVTDAAYLNAGFVNLLSSQTIRLGDATGTVQSKTQWFYDARNGDGTSDNDNGNIAMACQSNASGHDDTNYGCSSTTPRGNLTKIAQYTDPVSSTPTVKTYYGYDSLGNLVKVTDPRGNSTTISYTDNWSGTSSCAVSSAFAYPTLTTNAVGHQQTNWYNRCTGEVVETQDANNQHTTFAYNDPLLRQTGVGYPDNGGITLTYTLNQITKQITGGTATTTTVDGLGRTTHVQNADGTVDYGYSYDGQGGTTQSISNPHQSGSAPSTTTHFDALGRPTQVDYADGTSHSYSSYTDNCVTVTDAASRSRKLCTDGLGRLAQVYEDPNGVNYLTTYSYNTLDKLTDVLQNGAGTRHFVYDGLSRLTSATMPENGTTTYGYDNSGNLTSRTDAREVTATYSYDALNRLTSTTYSDGVTPNNYYSYDVAPSWMPDLQNIVGRLAASNNQYGGSTTGKATAATYSYDPMGRVIRIWEQTPSASPGGYTVSIGYDVAGNMTSLGYPDGRYVTQGMDTAGHLQTVTFDNWNGAHVGYNYLSSAAYSPDSSPHSMTFGNGATQTFDKNNRLQASEISIHANASGINQTIFDKQYAYTSSCQSTNNGNIMQIIDTLNNANSQGACYDNLNRLASFSNGDGSMQQSYSYDSSGNLSQSGTRSFEVAFGADNHINDSGFGYDLAGNLTQINVGGVTTSYAYDAEGRMSGINSGAVQYTYDPSGNRVRKTLSDGSYIEYIYLNGQVISEGHSDGTWSDYIYGNGQLIAGVSGSEPALHVHGNNCSGCQPSWLDTTFSTPLRGYQIQSGDRLVLEQKQVNISGGFQLTTLEGSNTWPNVTDQNGDILNDAVSQTDGNWHIRWVDLSGWAGQHVGDVRSTLSTNPPLNVVWDTYLRNVNIVSADGSVHAIFSAGMQPSFSQNGPGTETDLSASVDAVPNATNDPATTRYYLGDHLGSTRVVMAAAGWPVSSSTFYPFGQEQSPNTGANHYKFAGLERDAQNGETGLDHTMFRQYSSVMGRWMSPDPDLGSIDLANPQSLNRYSYGLNAPTLYVDPLGLNVYACTTTTVYEDNHGDGTRVVDKWTVCSQIGGGEGPGSNGPAGETGGGSPAAPSNGPNPIDNANATLKQCQAQAVAAAQPYMNDVKMPSANELVGTGVLATAASIFTKGNPIAIGISAASVLRKQIGGLINGLIVHNSAFAGCSISNGVNPIAFTGSF